MKKIEPSADEQARQRDVRDETRDPTDTAHPVGEEQAARNSAEDPPG